jgi:hypothetical protein
MSRYTIIVSGWRFATVKHSEIIMEALLPIFGEHGIYVLMREGECPYGGVDLIAKNIGLLWGWEIDPNPANWRTFGRKAGALRNGTMCAKGADKLLAFPGPGSTGTTNCIEWAKRYNIPVSVYPLEGDLKG